MKNLERIKREVADGLFGGGAISANDAPAVIERIERLEYLLGKVTPAACTCHVEGPDGIECWKCEIEHAIAN